MMRWFGFVEQIHKDGNDHADKAADQGRRHVDADVVDGRVFFTGMSCLVPC